MSTAEIIAELPRLTPSEIAQIRAKLDELTSNAAVPPVHPAAGIWKDRTDLPDEAAEASKVLGERLMRRDHE